jgi:hypothetical protein
MAVVLPQPTPTEEVLDFLLSAPTPEAVIALRPSPAAQERLRYLLDGNRNATLNDALSEADAQRLRAELEIYLQLEHFVRRLKIRARQRTNVTGREVHHA